jgi:hypothetical protein
LSLTSLLSAPEREVTSPSDFKVVGALLYIDQIIVYNAFYSTLTFYIIKDRCQMHALKVFRSPVWLLLHKLSSQHYRYIRKMRRGDRLPLTQYEYCWILILSRIYIHCSRRIWI